MAKDRPILLEIKEFENFIDVLIKAWQNYKGLISKKRTTEVQNK